MNYGDIKTDYSNRLEQINQKKELELNLIKQNLDRNQREQFDDIQKSVKFEIDNIRHEMVSDLDEKLNHEVVQLQK